MVNVVDGLPVVLGDVARVADGPDEPDAYTWIGFGPAETEAPRTGFFPAVHVAVAHVSELSRRSRRALGGREAGGGDRLPLQFRIQSECALTHMNARSGQNLSEVRTPS